MKKLNRETKEKKTKKGRKDMEKKGRKEKKNYTIYKYKHKIQNREGRKRKKIHFLSVEKDK